MKSQNRLFTVSKEIEIKTFNKRGHNKLKASHLIRVSGDSIIGETRTVKINPETVNYIWLTVEGSNLWKVFLPQLN